MLWVWYLRHILAFRLWRFNSHFLETWFSQLLIFCLIGHHLEHCHGIFQNSLYVI